MRHVASTVPSSTACWLGIAPPFQHQRLLLGLYITLKTTHKVIGVAAVRKQAHRAHEAPRVGCGAGWGGQQEQRWAVGRSGCRQLAGFSALLDGLGPWSLAGQFTSTKSAAQTALKQTAHPGRSSRQTSASRPRSPAPGPRQTAAGRRPGRVPTPGGGWLGWSGPARGLRFDGNRREACWRVLPTNRLMHR